MNDFVFTLSGNDVKADKHFVLPVVVVHDADLCRRDYRCVGKSSFDPVPDAQEERNDCGDGLSVIRHVLKRDVQFIPPCGG